MIPRSLCIFFFMLHFKFSTCDLFLSILRRFGILEFFGQVLVVWSFSFIASHTCCFLYFSFFLLSGCLTHTKNVRNPLDAVSAICMSANTIFTVLAFLFPGFGSLTSSVFFFQFFVFFHILFYFLLALSKMKLLSLEQKMILRAFSSGGELVPYLLS